MSASCSGVSVRWRLRQASGRQAEIDRAALVLLHVVQAMAHQHRELVDIGGLVGEQAGLAHADQRRVDALMRAAFRRQRHARGRRHDHEARILVAGVVQRIEAAGDERIVERADRQQARAEQLVAEPQRRELDEQVVLGDAELDMLAARRLAPELGRHDLELAEHVLGFGVRPQAAPVHPGAEIGRDRDVGRGGDDALATARCPRRRWRSGSCRSLPGCSTSCRWAAAAPPGSPRRAPRCGGGLRR